MGHWSTTDNIEIVSFQFDMSSAAFCGCSPVLDVVFSCFLLSAPSGPFSCPLQHCLCHTRWDVTVPSQWVFAFSRRACNIETTLFQDRCNVMTLRRRRYDVLSTVMWHCINVMCPLSWRCSLYHIFSRRLWNFSWRYDRSFFNRCGSRKGGFILRSGGGLDLQVSILAEGTRMFVRSLFRLKKQMLFVFVLFLLDM